MGYHIFSFAVDLKEIQQAIGSMDQGLFEEVQESDMLEHYASQEAPGALSTKDALEHLIFGKPYVTSSAHAYWYALIVLCDHLGEALPATHEISLGYETDLINQYLKEDFDTTMAIEEVLLTPKGFENLPAVLDWPIHGILDTAELVGLKYKLADINITDEQLEELLEEDEEKEMACDSIRQIKENVSFCLQSDLALISFCH